MRLVLVQNLSKGDHIIAYAATKTPRYGAWSKCYKAFAAIPFNTGDNKTAGSSFCVETPTPLSYDQVYEFIELVNKMGQWGRADLTIKAISDSSVLISGIISEIQEFESEAEDQYIQVFGSFIDVDGKSVKLILLKPDQKVFIL
jgi:hypothetical protein